MEKYRMFLTHLRSKASAEIFPERGGGGGLTFNGLDLSTELVTGNCHIVSIHSFTFMKIKLEALILFTTVKP